MLAINMFKITGTRKVAQYPEDPAEFKPLTEDELQRIKKERRQKDLQRKQKAAENRKHLANVRVVQRNLVFVVGLSQRLADPEVLKKHEYFGKFGKIHKVVINHSTSYAGAQGPSASAYVTYHKPEDALRAIQAVNNIYVDGRTLKASLGTTKYCSHFLRGAQCPKPDCMYLHELGEEAASFTKEEMQQGKHQEYEQKLYEGFMNSQNLSNHQTMPLPPSSTPSLTVPPPTTTSASTNSNNTSSSKAQRKKASSPPTIQPGVGSNSSHPPPNTNKEAWPSLSNNGGGSGANSGGRADRLTNGNKPPTQSPASQSSSTSSLSSASSTSSTSSTSSSSSAHKQDVQNAQNRAPGHHRNSNSHTELHNSHSHSNSKKGSQNNTSHSATSPLSVQSPQALLQHHPALQPSPPLHQVSPPAPQQVPLPPGVVPPPTQSPIGTSRRSPFDTSDSMSLFSNSGFPTTRNPKPAVTPNHTTEGISTTEIPDTIPVSSTTDWSAAFGFSSPVAYPPAVEQHEDDLGFDPWDESSKALADMIEKESYTQCNYSHMMGDHSRLSGLMNNGADPNRVKNLPPGFAPNHMGAYSNQLPRLGSSKMGMQFAPMANVNSQNAYHDMLSDLAPSSSMGGSDNHTTHQNTQTDGFSNMKDWQDGLRALLPNINISFGAPTAPATHPNHQHPPHPQHQQHQQQHPQSQRPHTRKEWSSSSCSSKSQLQSPTTDLSLDPAIVISGNITHSTSLSDDPPHWMASLHHLTEDNTNHRLPFVHQFPFRGPTWAPQAHHPPPGFHQSHLSSPTRVAETHRLAEGLQ